MGRDASTSRDPVDVGSGEGEHWPAMIRPPASVIIIT
jgi:hypothetical protein